MSMHMNHGSRFLCWSLTETRRLLWILGLALGVVVVLVRFFKIPDNNVLSSLFSSGNFAVFSNATDAYKSQVSNSNWTLNYTIEGRNKEEFIDNNGGTNKVYNFVNNSSVTNPSPSHGISSNATLHAVSISQMNELLLQSHSSQNATKPLWFSTVDEELILAKSEIKNAPLNYSSELYEPLYRNVSKFKRSYELMDKMLRVYIYKEGEKPIFHESILEGIYASEGWFLKQLESNKQFITEDPSKAHLFFIPFSSRLLELTLYVRNSHSRDNLIEFMKNYVEMLVQKYPFWNRTNGEDHFLAACHDWAPAETRGRMLSCLRALCNADIKTGFVIGKDVSLPTVYIRSAKNPLKDIGDRPVAAERSILAFFAGYMHGNVRPMLLKHWGKDPDMRILGRMPHVKGDKNYIEYMKSSKYCICARGYAVHSPRVVESIFFECVPVIVSDNYVPPFFEVLKWESFAVFILERDIPNLKKILMSISEEKYGEMQKRVREVQKHFLWHVAPVKYDLFHMILHSVWYNRVFRTFTKFMQ